MVEVNEQSFRHTSSGHPPVLRDITQFVHDVEDLAGCEHQ
jgi:hypothetical protein